MVVCLGLASAAQAQSPSTPAEGDARGAPIDRPSAQEAPQPTAGEDELGTEQAQVLVVQTTVRGYEIDPLAVLEAVGRELGVPVLATPVAHPALGTLRVEIDSERIAMRYQAPKGTEIARAVGTPASPPRAVETTALLAGNLVRDQASGLLASLQAKVQARRVALWSSVVAAGATSLAAAAGSNGRELRDPVAGQRAPHPGGDASAASEQPDPDEELEPLAAAPANLSLVHPVAIFPDSDERFVCLEVGMVYSYVGAVYGLSVSGVATRVARQVYGAAVHGAWGHHHGGVNGLGLSGVGLYVDGPERGLIVSGAVHVSSGDLAGVRMTGAVDVAEGAALGVQVTGGVNVGYDTVAGLQVAGAVNATGATVYGLQAAGGVNVANAVQGVQLAPVNVARHVEGVQIGVVNVAEHVEGTAIGLLSIAGNGRLSAVAWASNRTVGNVGVQSTVGPIYTLWGVGLHPGAGEVDYIVEPSFALGGHLPIDDFFLDQDIGYAWRVRFQNGESQDQRDVFRYRAKLGWRIVDLFAVFVGGGLWYELGPDDIGPEVGPEVLGGIQVF